MMLVRKGLDLNTETVSRLLQVSSHTLNEDGHLLNLPQNHYTLGGLGFNMC